MDVDGIWFVEYVVIDNFHSISKKMQTVKIGSLSLALPAFITAVAGFITGIIVMFRSQLWYIGYVAMLSSFIGAYTINCTYYGDCDTLAWFFVVLLFILLLGKILGGVRS